ncbi:protein-tyrosine phosphatase family protein [Nocardiopsis baichengensis]|uniref:dual specificity protein phosphatase family protein n=1 Tax=Nocardiopsis baichengensis TaxID=280240 RepID=UPI0003454B98|nr:dual specificity protein phosphatase family protein [Nocardiopsis baichengensis]
MPADDRTDPPSWPRDDPRYDRCAGAWTGAAAAACIVGAPPAMAEEATHPDGDGAGPALLSWLISTALEGMADPATVHKAVDTLPDRAWALALRATAAEGRIPAPEPVVPPHSPMGAGWRAAAEAPAPALEPARAVFPCSQLVEAVWRAYAAGGDEAAMYAGAMAGARWGASGIPLEAQRRLADIVAPRTLVRRAVVLARGTDPAAWPEAPAQPTGAAPSVNTPFCTPHPHDPGVLLGNVAHLRSGPDVDAVVSLNRIGPADAPAHLPARDRIEVWLADAQGEGVNPNLHFVLDEAAGAVAALRAEGKRVLLHCAAGQSRTPAVAAHYATLACGADVVEALRLIIRATGGHLKTPALSTAAAALNGVDLADPAAALFPDGTPAPREHRGD